MCKRIYQLLIFAFLLFQINAFAVPKSKDLEKLLQNSTEATIVKIGDSIGNVLLQMPLETAISTSYHLLKIVADLPHGKLAADIILKKITLLFDTKGIKFDFILFCNSLLDDPAFDSPKIKYPLFNILGSYYYSIRNFSESKYYIEKSLKIDSTDESGSTINTYTTLGFIEIHNTDYEKAFKCFKKALTIAQNTHDTIWIGLGNGNLGDLYKKMGNFEQAIFHLRKDFEISLSKKSYGSAANALTSIAGCYLINKQPEAAKKTLDSALAVLLLENKIYQSTSSFIDIYNATSEYYKQKLNFTEAYHYLQLATKLTDSLSKKNIQISLELNLAKINADKQQQKKILLNTTIYNKKKNEILFSVVIISILVALVFATLLLKQKNRLNTILKEKNELVSKEKEQIEIRRNDLQQANEHKSKLLSIVAHDLKTPINNLQGLLQMLEAGIITNQEFFDQLPEVQHKVDTLFGTIDNLLSWTFSQLNNISTQPKIINLEPVVQTIFNFLQPTADSKKIILEHEITSSTQVYCDPNQLEIIIRNLVSNAIKFSPENSKVVVEAKLEENNMQIRIIDVGIGIEPSILKTMFSSNKPTSTYGTKGEKGVGLGLIICKEFVQNNNGKIVALANEPNGTIMQISLPTS